MPPGGEMFRFSEMSEKRTNALTNRPELLGDCHDQCAHWSRNDSSNERSNTNLPHCCCQSDFKKSFPEIREALFGYKRCRMGHRRTRRTLYSRNLLRGMDTWGHCAPRRSPWEVEIRLSAAMASKPCRRCSFS